MEKGIFETLTGVLVRPTSTIRSVCQGRPIGWAIIVYLVVSVITTVAGIEPGMLEELGLLDLGMPIIVVGSSIINIIIAVILTAIYHVAAWVLGGRGSYGGFFCGFAFAILPNIFAAPLAVIALLPTVGALLSGLGAYGIMVWVIILSILAVRENYLVSTGRAILIFLLAFLSLLLPFLLFLWFWWR